MHKNIREEENVTTLINIIKHKFNKHRIIKLNVVEENLFYSLLKRNS